MSKYQRAWYSASFLVVPQQKQVSFVHIFTVLLD